MSRCSHARRATICVMLALTFAPGMVSAHEGHAPLPTKGAQIDIAKGLITLSPEAQRTLAVKTADVELQQPNEKVLAYAMVVAPWQQHAFATSRAAGRIAKLNVKPGQRVTARQVLAEVESLDLETLQLQLLNAVNDQALATKVVDSLAPLENIQAVAAKDIFEARSKLEESQAAVDIARSKLRNLGLSEDDVSRLAEGSIRQLNRLLPVFSPIAGTVVHSDLSVGRVIEPSEHLFEIVDLAKVWVRISVLEKDLHRVAVGQQVQLTLAAFPKEVVEGHITVIVPFLDPESHLGNVWAEIVNPVDQPARYLPGMYGQAQVIVSPPGKMVSFPADGLIGESADKYVLVEEEATSKAYVYRRQNVVVALQNNSRVFIEDGGLFPGDRVVTSGSHELATFFGLGILKLSPEALKNGHVVTDKVSDHEVQRVINIEGIVEVPPDHQAIISTQVAGTLEKVLVERGQAVKKGETVAELAGVEFQELQLQFIQWHLRATLAKKLLDRRQSLSDTQSLAKRQLWETESQYNAAINERDAAERKLRSLGLSAAMLADIAETRSLAKTLSLRSPIDGIVVRFDKTLGQAIKAQEPIFEIHNLSRVWVEGYLSERDLAQVAIGQPARVRVIADPAFMALGSVVRSGQVLGNQDRTLPIWVELESMPQIVLQANMLARITLTLGESQPSLAVPLGAIAREATRTYVFVRDAKGVFERRFVKTGREDDRYVEILSGLKLGETIAVSGAAELQTAYASIR